MSEPETKKASSVIRVGGVPEHFNYSWTIAQERGIFAKHGVEVEFVEVKLGTGAMITAAKAHEVDVIVALTEGLVQDIAKGSDLRLLGTYVGSPLCWAISSGAKSSIQTVEDLRGGKFGISRYGSGSHLMAYVLAMQRGWDPEKDVNFEVKGSFEQLRNGVNDLSTDAFMWETFTTKPFHDSGEVRRVGEITTPWPCFMLAALREVVTGKLEQIQRVLAAVHEAAVIFHTEKDAMPAQIAARYGLREDDAREWYNGVRISADHFVSEAALERVVETLKTTKALPADLTIELASLVDDRLGMLHRDLKSMTLYDKSELVVSLYRQLQAAGLSAGDITYEQLLPFDQHHYHGTAAVDDVVREAGIKDTSRVINFGSGLGGPARYMAGKYGCQVLACELQDDLHRTAVELTTRCSLGARVHHVSGDFQQISQHLHKGGYDVIVSWLTVLHIADRVELFKNCYSLLRPGGIFFAADFVQNGKLTRDEWKTLRDDVGSASIAGSIEAYTNELELAGFKVLKADDMTADWRGYTKDRSLQFATDHQRLSNVMGSDVYLNLKRFYDIVAGLYNGGNLGGLHVYAQKPLGW